MQFAINQNAAVVVFEVAQIIVDLLRKSRGMQHLTNSQTDLHQYRVGEVDGGFRPHFDLAFLEEKILNNPRQSLESHNLIQVVLNY